MNSYGLTGLPPSVAFDLYLTETAEFRQHTPIKTLYDSLDKNYGNIENSDDVWPNKKGRYVTIAIDRNKVNEKWIALCVRDIYIRA